MMNIDDIKAAHSTNYRVSTFKPISCNDSARSELAQKMAEFKGKIETIPAGKTMALLNFEQLMRGYAKSNLELKNSKKKKH